MKKYFIISFFILLCACGKQYQLERTGVEFDADNDNVFDDSFKFDVDNLYDDGSALSADILALLKADSAADTGIAFFTNANATTIFGFTYTDLDFGAFTGSTIPDDSDAKEAFQALETEVETKADTTGTVGAFTLADQTSQIVDFLSLTAGEAITAGNPVYAKWDAGLEEICIFAYDADAADAADFFMLGIASSSASAEAAVQVWVGKAMLMRRDTFSFPTATYGKPLWSTTTAGGISSTPPPTAGDHVIKIGTAVAANYILYRFSIDDTQREPAP